MLLNILVAVALALQAFAYPSEHTAADLGPWTELGISLDDAAIFAASGTTPHDGFQIIEAERALFNGMTTQSMQHL